MGKTLKKNICNLEDYTVLTEVKDLSILQQEYIGGALEYACHFWTKHLLQTPVNGSCVEEVQEAINRFSMRDLLHWIEVLVLTENLNVGVHAMKDVEEWCTLVSAIGFFVEIHTNNCSERNFLQVGK